VRYLFVLLSLGACFKPSQGTWTTSNGSLGETTCAERDQHPVKDGSTFTLALNDGSDPPEGATAPKPEKGSFRLRFDGDPVYGCVPHGKSFTCGAHHDDVDASEDGSAVLHLTTTFDGTFLDDANLTAHRYVDTRCEGDTCADVADAQGRTFDCSTAAAFQAVLTDPTLPGSDTDS
jgi:hypothetical protein